MVLGCGRAEGESQVKITVTSSSWFQLPPPWGPGLMQKNEETLTSGPLWHSLYHKVKKTQAYDCSRPICQQAQHLSTPFAPVRKKGQLSQYLLLRIHFLLLYLQTSHFSLSHIYIQAYFTVAKSGLYKITLTQLQLSSLCDHTNCTGTRARWTWSQSRSEESKTTSPPFSL